MKHLNISPHQPTGKHKFNNGTEPQAWKPGNPQTTTRLLADMVHIINQLHHQNKNMDDLMFDK